MPYHMCVESNESHDSGEMLGRKRKLALAGIWLSIDSTRLQPTHSSYVRLITFMRWQDTAAVAHVTS